MTTYQIVKKELKNKSLSKEQKNRLESLKDFQIIDKLARAVKVTRTNNPLLSE